MFNNVFFEFLSAFAAAVPNIRKQARAARDRKSGAYSTASPMPLQALFAAVLAPRCRTNMPFLTAASG